MRRVMKEYSVLNSLKIWPKHATYRIIGATIVLRKPYMARDKTNPSNVFKSIPRLSVQDSVYLINFSHNSIMDFGLWVKSRILQGFQRHQQDMMFWKATGWETTGILLNPALLCSTRDPIIKLVQNHEPYFCCRLWDPVLTHWSGAEKTGSNITTII